MTSNPHSSDFDYRQYSLEHLGNWVHDTLNNEILSAQDIYDAIIKNVDESIEYHSKELSKSVELSSLLKGERKNSFDDPYISSAADRCRHPYHYDGWDGYDDFESPLPTQHTEEEPKAKCDKDWTNFWEENYYPEESHWYTEEELGAMCDKAASDQEKDQCREYNLREAEYYNKYAESQKSKYYWETDRNKEYTKESLEL